jgi:hypothetical protein
VFRQDREQIARVEQLSDAYHLPFAGDDSMVAPLLEATRTN